MNANSNHIDDLDYLYATARARALERSLLTRERLRAMCEARGVADIEKLLGECGWQQPDLSTRAALEQTLAAERAAAFRTVLSIAPDKKPVYIFLLKYDYHNIKTILKGEAAGAPYERLLLDCGRVPLAELRMMLRENNFANLSPLMRRAVSEAQEVLARTGDPQYADIALDRGCFEEMASLARQADSEFMRGYVSLLADSVNLRAAVRLKKMGRGYEYLKQSFVRGGFVSISRLLAEITPDLLESVYSRTPLHAAAQAAAAALRSEAGLAALDRACDDALMHYLQSGKFVGLGEQPLLGYIGAKEAELVAVRVIVLGRAAGLEAETIMERLREPYA